MFKHCSVCEAHWETRDSFLSDPEIVLTGYQMDFENVLAGHILFNHKCRTTLSIPVSAFDDLHSTPITEETQKGLSDCAGCCMEKHDLAKCTFDCECVFIRELLQVINAWQKEE